MPELAGLLVTPNDSIATAMTLIDRNGKGIVVVVDKERRLLSTVTDGDIRRAILAGWDLELPVHALATLRHPPVHHALTAPAGTPDVELIRLMNASGLRQIPLVDAQDRVTAVAVLTDLLKEYEMPIQAIVMAGGGGTRLRPLTQDVPKPMLPVGDRPLLELIIQQLRTSGIRRLHLATHYKADLIAQHFGDGREFGVQIRYVEETQPLGTAGALSLLEASHEPLLVINGDILTRIDFRAMADFHRDQRAEMTVAVKPHEVQVPYGVIETDGTQVTRISEKPVVRHFINAGIYLINPEACRTIPTGQPYDMPDLIRRLVAGRRRVVSFLVREYWLDIGQPHQYQQAVADVKQEKF